MWLITEIFVVLFKILGTIFESIFRKIVPPKKKDISGQTVLITGERWIDFNEHLIGRPWVVDGPVWCIDQYIYQYFFIVHVGAGGGLGLQLAISFAKQGAAKLILWDINQGK